MVDDEALLDTLRCPHCGATLVEEGNFCHHCGLALDAPELEQVWQTSQRIVKLLRQREQLLHQARAGSRYRPQSSRPDQQARQQKHPARLSPPPAGAVRAPSPVQPDASPSPDSPPSIAADTPAASPSSTQPPAEPSASTDTLQPENPAPDNPARGKEPARPDLGSLSTRTYLVFIGAGLLILAAIISTVASRGVDSANQALLLLVATGAFFVLTDQMRRHSLLVSAEALAACCVAMMLLDLYALRASGLVYPAQDDAQLNARVYWAGGLLGIVVVAALATRVVPLVPRLTVATLGQLPLPLLVASINSLGLLVLLLGVQACALVAIEARWGDQVRALEGGKQARLSAWLRVVASAGAGAAWTIGLVLSLSIALMQVQGPRLSGVLCLLGLALVPWTLAYLHRDRPGLCHAGTAVATAVMLLAALVLLIITGMPVRWMPAALLLMVLGMTWVAAQLPRSVRPGPMAATLGYCVAALVVVGVPLLGLLISPLQWWLRPWSIAATQPASHALSPMGGNVTGADGWFGPGSAPAAVATAALATAVFALMATALRPDPEQPANQPEPNRPSDEPTYGWLDQRYSGRIAHVVGTATALAIPVVLPVPHVVGVALQMLCAAVLVLRLPVLMQRLRTPGGFATSMGIFAVTIALSWSVASRVSSVVATTMATAVLVIATARAAGGRQDRYAGLSVLSVAVQITVAGLALGVNLGACAVVVCVVVAVLAVIAGLLPAGPGQGAQVGAAGVFAVAWLLTASLSAMGWLAVVGALACALVAGRRDRRMAAVLCSVMVCVAVGLLAYSYAAGLPMATLALTVTAADIVLVGTYVVVGSSWQRDLSEPGEHEVGDADVDASARAHTVPSAEDPDVAEPDMVGAHLGWQRREAARATQTVGTLAYVIAVMLALIDSHRLLLSVVLALGSLTAAALSVQRHHRQLWWVAWGLGSAAWWSLLPLAHVTTVEAYTWPSVAVLLLVGVRRRARNPAMRSWRAYGLGLVGGLAPSVIASPLQEALMRTLVVTGVALACTLIGARARLKAPLAVGATALIVISVYQFSAYATVIPRWVAVASVGALLFSIGATYDKRLRDLRRLRAHYNGLA